MSLKLQFGALKGGQRQNSVDYAQPMFEQKRAVFWGMSVCFGACLCVCGARARWRLGSGFLRRCRAGGGSRARCPLPGGTGRQEPVPVAPDSAGGAPQRVWVRAAGAWC